jgi:hypothetical protein
MHKLYVTISQIFAWAGSPVAASAHEARCGPV